MGQYGTGKTQLSQLLMDSLQMPNIVTIKADLGLASFATFALDLSMELREFLTTSHPDLMPSIDPLLTRIEQSTQDADIYRSIVQVFRILSRRKIVIIINLDEIDMIPNLEAFTPWANFIVMVNQHIDTGVHIIFYMAPRDLDRLWDKDARLSRFSRYISKAISPGATFGSKFVEAVAHLGALYEVVNDVQLSEQMLSLLSFYLDNFNEKLRKQILRKFNTDTYQILEFLVNLQSKNYWQNISPLFKESPAQLMGLVENSVKQLLVESPIEFEFADTLYRVKYNITAGQFTVTQQETDAAESHMIDVSCIVTYTPIRNLEKLSTEIKSLIEQGPVYAIVIGPPLKGVEKELLISELDNPANNPLQILSMFAQLVQPLILYTYPDYESDFNLRRQLVFWFELISNVKQSLRSFFGEVVEKRYESELQHQLEELRQSISILKPEFSYQPPVIENNPSQHLELLTRRELGDQPSVSDNLTKTEIEILLRIMALFAPRFGKKKENVFREVANDLRRHSSMNVTEGQIRTVAQRLVQREFLRSTPTQYRKTATWTPRSIFKSFDLQ